MTRELPEAESWPAWLRLARAEWGPDPDAWPAEVVEKFPPGRCWACGLIARWAGRPGGCDCECAQCAGGGVACSCGDPERCWCPACPACGGSGLRGPTVGPLDE